MKVIINECFGGFEISLECLYRLIQMNSSIVQSFDLSEYYGGKPIPENEFIDFKDGFLKQKWGHNSLIKDNKIYSLNENYGNKEKTRTHPDLIKLVKEIGKESCGTFAELKIVKIPDNIEFEIEEYDGNEHIAEKHRTWS